VTDPALVRRYEAADRDGIRALAHRLTEGVAPWRDPEAVLAAVTGWVDEALASADAADHAVFVAVDESGVAGFVSGSEQRHFSGELDAYVGELVVHPRAARTGVGQALMSAVEDWARSRGRRRLTLETGAANLPARRFYEALGYDDEDVRLSRGL
jgi:GNAT superfamily N-acetyltransferase